MKRILLKLSGEALAGDEKKGFDEATVIAVAKQIRAVAEEGAQIGIVIGGGNFWSCLLYTSSFCFMNLI